MGQMQPHPSHVHPIPQHIHYLHGILGCGEDAFVRLNREFHTLRLKPRHRVFVTPSPQQTPHQFVTSRVTFGQLIRKSEGVGQIATPSACHRQFRHGTTPSLEDVYGGIASHHPRCMHCTEASRSPCPYDGYPHPKPTRESCHRRTLASGSIS